MKDTKLKIKKSLVLSALDAANVCGVANQSIINWVNKGFIKAYRTPGGQYRIYPEDLLSFLENKKMQVPEELLEMVNKRKEGDPRILIVDDDVGLNSVVKSFLSSHINKVDIEQAFDGFEAGSKMIEFRPKIMLLDLDLPGVDGVKICKDIKLGKFASTEIIVITALEEPDLEEKLYGFGVKEYLRKPLNLNKLCESVKSLLA